ncbi:MAG: GNAT family N-acetyltransferase [Acetobacteraceae bacterium]|nr:GNAT family N-acetyltransferase [Acetobacteraceae bacterium]
MNPALLGSFAWKTGVAAVRVRLLEARDIARLAALMQSEGWATTALDLGRYLDLSPEGCFVLEGEGGPVGLITTVSYGEVAWLGNLILEPPLRGRGLGHRLLTHALEWLEAQGIRSVYLESVPEAQGLYLRAGFSPYHRVVKFEGKAPGGGEPLPSPGQVGPAEQERVLEMDRAGWKVDRGRVLALMLRAASLFFEPGAFLMASRVGADRWRLGPWGSAQPGEAAAVSVLERCLGALAPGAEVVAEAPGLNGPALKALRAVGLRPVRENIIMRRGPGAGEDLSLVWALASAGDLG